MCSLCAGEVKCSGLYGTRRGGIRSDACLHITKQCFVLGNAAKQEFTQMLLISVTITHTAQHSTDPYPSITECNQASIIFFFFIKESVSVAAFTWLLSLLLHPMSCQEQQDSQGSAEHLACKCQFKNSFIHFWIRFWLGCRHPVETSTRQNRVHTARRTLRQESQLLVTRLYFLLLKWLEVKERR